MVFSSYRFLFLFFPVTAGVYHLLRRTGNVVWVKLWLAAASLVFYGLGQPDFLLGFAGSIALNYLILLAMRKSEKRGARIVLMTASAVWNVGLLVYFKYTNFLLQNINWVLRTDFDPIHVILPIGISFFTFQILAFTVSYFRGDCAFPTPLDYVVYVTFFPQLIVGPVVKHEELMPQIEGAGLLRFDPVWIYRGVMLFSIGCAKKILLANPMIDYATAFYGGDVTAFTSPEAWLAVFCYVFAYYFDFSGYIDMARGLGCFFGVSLPINFDSPYQARDFGDFWRRWNITISRFFNETIFSNLFGFGDGRIRLVLATLATFVVSGIWHGAAWHYIIWGVVNGLLVSLSNLRAVAGRKPLPKAPAIALTFLVGAVIRVLFDATGMTQSFTVYRMLFDPRMWRAGGSIPAQVLQLAQAQWPLLLVLAFGAAICFFAPNANGIIERERFRGRDAVFSGALLGLSLLFMTKVSTFLYFNF